VLSSLGIVLSCAGRLAQLIVLAGALVRQNGLLIVFFLLNLLELMV